MAEHPVEIRGEICGCSYTQTYNTATLRMEPVRISCMRHLHDPQPEPPIIILTTPGT